MSEQDWERRAAQCRNAMSRLSWLVGSWRGHGTQNGVARICEVETQLLFDGTFLQSRERIYTSAGVVEHEDLTVYNASPDEGADAIWATAYMIGGNVVRYRVHVSGGTVTCEPEGFGARLSIERLADAYRVRIFYPNDAGAWTEDAVVDYTRRG
jgi:hypothetical protein